jgi:hypothetical protein
MLFVFGGGMLTAGQIGTIRLQAEELRSYAFRNRADAGTLLIPRLASIFHASHMMIFGLVG